MEDMLDMVEVIAKLDVRRALDVVCGYGSEDKLVG
jgi:hypothetical protein